MVAYSFAPQFVDQVEALTKRQTVRAHRKRHARPGEPIQLYAGMRTKHCRKLVDNDPVCLSVGNIAVDVHEQAPQRIVGIELEGIPLSDAEIEAFALADGFGGNVDGWARTRMGIFWLKSHGAGRFEGVLIRWSAAAC